MFRPLAVALFNLIPGFPLDGGRVFRALVWGWSGDAGKGMRWAVLAGKGVAYGLMVGGLVAVSKGYLINGLWLAAIGWFLLTAAESSGRAYVVDRLLRHVPAYKIMQHELPSVASDTSVMEWIDRDVLTVGQRAYLVHDGRQVIGLVTLSDSAKLPRERWSEFSVSRIMTPTDKLHAVSPQTDVAEVLRLMQQHAVIG